MKRLLPILLGVLLLLAPSPPAAAQAEAVSPVGSETQTIPTLLAVGRVTHTDGTLVVFDLDRQVDWRTRSVSARRLEVDLEDALLSQGLADQQYQSGLVSRISISSLRGERNLVTVTVETREPAFFSLERRQNSVELHLQTASSVALGGTARIGPGDKLNVDVFGTSELDGQPRVTPDGRIALPLLGRFDIAGLTPEQAEERIAALLREGQFLKNPKVFVVVEETALGGISVQGAVNRPGIYPARGSLSLLEVLGIAGGLDRGRQSSDKVVIIRRDAGGAQSRLEIDASRLIDEGDLGLNVPILPGDIVMAPESKVFSVHVTGAVRNPGSIEFLGAEGISVLQAITAAGGPTERAKLGKVSIIRRLSSGEQETLWVDVKKIRTGKRPDIALQAGDTVVLREWFL